MEISKLQYISQAAAGSHLTAIEKVLREGGRWIQVRLKDESEPVVTEVAIAANKLCLAYGARLIVNDYPRVALAADAYGVHLGLDDMPVKDARELLGPHKCIGGTANTFQHILQRVEEGVDYIGLGPFRFTRTKKNLSPIVGLSGYTQLMQQVREAGITIPIIAIGGIELPDLKPIKQTGIYGVALSGLLTHQVLNEEFYVEHSR
jgi:thiamine-phosphate pyrophosphorylase